MSKRCVITPVVPTKRRDHHSDHNSSLGDTQRETKQEEIPERICQENVSFSLCLFFASSSCSFLWRRRKTGIFFVSEA